MVEPVDDDRVHPLVHHPAVEARHVAVDRDGLRRSLGRESRREQQSCRRIRGFGRIHLEASRCRRLRLGREGFESLRRCRTALGSSGDRGRRTDAARGRPSRRYRPGRLNAFQGSETKGGALGRAALFRARLRVSHQNETCASRSRRCVSVDAKHRRTGVPPKRNIAPCISNRPRSLPAPPLHFLRRPAPRRARCARSARRPSIRSPRPSPSASPAGDWRGGRVRQSPLQDWPNPWRG